MTDKQKKEDEAEETKPIDLSELSGLSFGTAWVPLKRENTRQEHAEQRSSSQAKKSLEPSLLLRMESSVTH